MNGFGYGDTQKVPRASDNPLSGITPRPFGIVDHNDEVLVGRPSLRRCGFIFAMPSMSYGSWKV